MFLPLVFVAAACLLTGLGVLLAIAVNSSGGHRAGGTVAQILYDAEHPEERRERASRAR
jgi:hypothetical protein